MIQIETEDAVKAWLSATPQEPASFHRLDLTALDQSFANVSVTGCVFLGCSVGKILSGNIAQDKAGVISELSALPAELPAFASGIYTVADLYEGMRDDGTGWETTPDHKGFTFFNVKKNTPRRLTPIEMLAARIHDTVQQQAVEDYLKDKQVVAIMGGHDFKRALDKADKEAGKADVYWECVVIAKRLTEEGFLVLTGGGPGVMEAGNLGALLAHESEARIQEVRALLTNHGFETAEWRATAIAARKLILGDWKQTPPPAKFSLGIPTWLYGHEPPNLFAGYQSKMFYNSLREDGLVTLANSGIIYFEGNAGTVQEIFQDATQNYYLGEGQAPTPMVFYNSGGYWSRGCGDLSWPTDVPVDKRKPVLPLIKQLATEKRFQNAVFVSDKPHDVVKFLIDERNRQRPHVADVKLGNSKSVMAQLDHFLDLRGRLLNCNDPLDASLLRSLSEQARAKLTELGWTNTAIRDYNTWKQGNAPS